MVIEIKKIRLFIFIFERHLLFYIKAENQKKYKKLILK